MKKGSFKYSSYKGVVSNTVPGRCYSIAELLQRVLRGQPLPQVGTYEEDKRNLSDEEIEADIDRSASHPMVDKDADEIEAYNAKESIDEHVKIFEETQKKKSKK